MPNKLWFSGMIVLLLLLVLPVVAGAQDGLEIAVTTTQSCDQVIFDLTIAGGMQPYDVELKYGDSEVFALKGTTDTIFNLDHAYPAHGAYAFSAEVTDADDLSAEFEGQVVIDGPVVTLKSTPSPPLLTIDGGEASIKFDVEVTGGVEPYTYRWDLDQDGLPDVGLDGVTVSDSYTKGGEYEAAVTVTDGCDLADTATLTVIVDDPEDDPEEACHPTAQKIAEAVSSLFPEGRAAQVYTCEDIFNIFEGALTGSQLGFGRLWKAYQLTQTIDDLSWEEIRDWKLEYSSWGALTQLNRVSEFLDDYGIRDLMDLVISEEYALSDIRAAARSVLRYEAEFEDALQRIGDGASSGELGQFYKLVSELEIEPEVLDQYLADGMSFAEIRHAAKLSERMGTDWTAIVESKSLDHSWGEISQAHKLADDDYSADEILAMGVKEFRAEQRENERALREEERTQRDDERNNGTAERIAEQYEVQAGDILALFNGECEGSWSCVRKVLRKEERTQGTNDRDQRTANQIASKYDVSTEDVMTQFLTTCSQDWNCVRAHYRELNSGPRGKDKKK